jgi:hypothetical protein
MDPSRLSHFQDPHHGGYENPEILAQDPNQQIYGNFALFLSHFPLV